MTDSTPTPTGLFPPEGTPAGARFYIRHVKQGLIIRHWEPCPARRGYPGGPYWMRPAPEDDLVPDFSPESNFAQACTLLVRIPAPEDLLRHYDHVRELQQANSDLVEAGRAATADAERWMGLAKATMTESMEKISENLRLKASFESMVEAHDSLKDFITDVAAALGCQRDNDAILAAIAKLKASATRRHPSLQPNSLVIYVQGMTGGEGATQILDASYAITDLPWISYPIDAAEKAAAEVARSVARGLLAQTGDKPR